MITVLLMSVTVTGLLPQSVPVLGTFSYALRDSLQRFLEIGDNEFYSLFGSVTGLFSLLWSIGYASNKMSAVSYYMLDKTKIHRILLKGNLSLNDKGKITLIEKRIGIDIDGDDKIGGVSIKPATEMADGNNIVSEMVGTFNELTTILSVDKDTLKKTISENDKMIESKVEDYVATVVAKKPTSAFKPNKF